jgi:hypothetical protein
MLIELGIYAGSRTEILARYWMIVVVVFQIDKTTASED